MKNFFLPLSITLAISYLLIEEVRPRLFPKRFGEVIESTLFRSGRIHPDIYQTVLADKNINSIVTLTGRKEDHYWQAKEIEIAEELSIPIHRFNLNGDGTGNPSTYKEALSKVVKEISSGKSVLVHCAAGTNRTGGLVYLYRTIFENMSSEDAVEEMINFDFDPNTNGHLIPFLKAISPSIKEDLVEQGLLIEPL
tara:strand:+ start:129 stop:713 length:585 start_codon:yes stop_codon:yes gene_type:complete